ncbi:chorismate synthase [candidate division KSB3 bacterium]|uniref:Chorismate synthase n=1 Tax=candidate division KSB3 bacterium TaxID=2044937 RepID=A0A2G6E984_9BACT|nr:MAG: chorismate synthase [candidate division KSB3 bacterium]PIE30642.1 MAG: chorismate synthase [candidate division KSB3 bacterium]
MNSFGRIFRVSLFGESHGKSIGVVIDGVPAGIPLTPEDFRTDLERRRPGAKGTTLRREDDLGLLKSGVFHDRSSGAPLIVQFENTDTDSSAYENIRQCPRPGHADFTSFHKFGGLHDYRGSGHFSGRITLGLVAAGVVAKKILKGISIQAEVVEAGGSARIEEPIEDALKDHDSIGGIIECRVNGLPPGLGEPFFDKTSAMLAHIIFAVPGIRGLEFGAGFAAARMKGSQCNDPILDKHGTTASNHSGGLNGGITNGNELFFRVAVKPTSSIGRAQNTIHLPDGTPTTLVVKGRHDTCFALRLPVVIEAATAIVLADFMLLEQRVPRVYRQV